MQLLRVVISVALMVLLLSTASFAIYSGKQTSSQSDYEVRGLIIKMGQDVMLRAQKSAAGDITTGMSEMDQLNSKWEVKRVASVLKTGQADDSHPFARYYVIEANGSPDYSRMKSEYEQLSYIERVELDYKLEFFAKKPKINDPLFPYQWNLYNTGQEHPVVDRIDGDFNDTLMWVSGVEGADIAAYRVLSSPPDNTVTVVVGLIDSGVDLDHIELADQIWSNSREVAGNGIDDDNNGYTDDVVGYDFNGGAGDNDPTDELGHGTHCAGIIAASFNNRKGIAPVCPEAKIMALRTSLYTSDNVAAIVYATDNGADVISMSWGGSPAAWSLLLEEAMMYARSKGLTLCASAGNFGAERSDYPAFSNQTISVGASTDDDEVTSFSTYNDHIDVVAPGESILSLRADALDPYGLEGYDEPDVHIIDDYYYLMSGTSMACPTVAGVVAYLKAISPGLSPDEVKDILIENARDFVDPYGIGANLPGWDKYSGWGCVDLWQSNRDAPSVRVDILSPFPNQIISGTAISVTGTADGDDFQSYTLEYGQGWNPAEWTEISSSNAPVTGGVLGSWDIASLAGHYTLRLRAGDVNYCMVTVFLGQTQVVDIVSLAEGDTLEVYTSIVGSAYWTQFSHWLLDYRPIGSTEWVELATSSTPVMEEELKEWNTSYIAEGDYVLRLAVYSVTGFEDMDTVIVTKAPARVPDWLVDLGGTASSSPTYADLDDDGQRDIIIGTSIGIKVFNADGTEKTTGIPSFPTGDFSTFVSVGNLDNDGIDDVVAVRYDVPGVYGFPSSGGDFVIPVSSQYLDYDVETIENQMEYYWNYVMLSDVDGDGIDEMFLQCHDKDQYAYGYVIPLEVGDVSVSTVWTYMMGFAPADLDRNGESEIYCFRHNQNRLEQLSFSGSVLASYDIGDDMDGEQFKCHGITSYDVDSDGDLELIVAGCFGLGQPHTEYRIYAFDENFSVKEGWPQNTGINQFWLPSSPVFGDVDGDGSPEYFVTWSSYGTAFLQGWHVDGTPYLFGGRTFIDVELAFFGPPLLADVNGDWQTDIVLSSLDNWFWSWSNRLFAWDNQGNMLSGFPFMVTSESNRIHTTPLVGDMNRDGQVDVTVSVAVNKLAHYDLQEYYSYCASPATSWRYNGSLDGAGPSFGFDCVDYICGDVDSSGVIDTLDADYLVEYMFNDGPPPKPLESADMNCLPEIDGGDIIWLVNYLWHDGPAPCDCETSAGKYVTGSTAGVDIASRVADGITTVSLNSRIPLLGVRLEIDGADGSRPVNLISEKTSLYSRESSGVLEVDMFDIKGVLIPAGEHTLLQIEGSVSITNASAVDRNGNVIALSLAKTGSGMPSQFALDQNYPNPFNPMTTITFSLPETHQVKLEVYNMLGQRVDVVAEGKFEVGTHSVEWDATSYASGLYFYRLEVGDFTATKKMMLVR